MLSPRFANIHSPVLVVDLGIFTMRALLYAPGKGSQEQYGFLLPSPECTLTERIHNCTAKRRPLYMAGVCMGLTPFEALFEHLDAGFEVSMHPDTAASLTENPARLEARGVRILRSAPSNASHIQAADFDPYFWNTLCDMAELPRADTVLVSAADYGRPFDFPEKGRGEILKDFFRDFSGPRNLLIGNAPSDSYRRALLRLQAIKNSTGIPALDFATAFIFGMLSLTEVADHAGQRDVMLLHVGEHFIEASIVHDNMLYAFLELPFKGLISPNGLSGADPALILNTLKAYYAGTLTADDALAMGGYIWRADPMPYLGDSLCPIYSSGSNAELVSEYSRVMGLQLDSVMINCWGLLNAYNIILGN